MRFIKGQSGVIRRGWCFLTAAGVLAACGASPEDPASTESSVGTEAERASTKPEDGLKDGFDTFINTFEGDNFDAQYRIGYGFHPGLTTEKVTGSSGALASGQATLEMNTGRVTAFLNNVPEGANFELWFVKNQPGGTVAPESGDLMVKVGAFSSGGEFRQLDVDIGEDVIFDLDQIVVTRFGKKPTQSRIAVGDRTLLEKRLFRFRQGQPLDKVSGTLAKNIETTDPLVARGAQLFFNETFGGNGRTCGTCHRADDSLTIDPAFIAKLPKTDPLFVAETNPALAKLENTQLLRSQALITENLDGFDDPTHNFVLRGVPHTLSLGLTNGISNGFNANPPDHRLGWAGDGAPGRGTLHEFAFGAIVQHFTKSLQRRPGIDFRLPTQEELDALEAFQLFTGRQKDTDFESIFPTDQRALNGQTLFNRTGCTNCHTDTFGFTDSFNANFDTGVSNLLPNLPRDDGFLSPGDGTFNVPPLVEAADTPPFFHNNAVTTIEDAVGFYFSPTFQASPSSFFIFNQLTTDQQGDVAAFLRVINSAANIDQVRKRVAYVKDVRSSGNTDLLSIALADTRDALNDLSAKDLSPDVQAQLSDAQTQLKAAIKDRDSNRPSEMSQLIVLLDEARAALFTTTPPDGGGFGGSGPGVGGADPGAGGDPGTAGTFTMGGGVTGGSGPIGGSISMGGSVSMGGSTAAGGAPDTP
jgi:hypothetical protein